MLLHFVSGELTIRQLLDWAFFIEKHTRLIDWGWFYEVLDSFGMYSAVSYFNSICVDDLGFKSTIFPPIIIGDPALKKRILSEIIFNGSNYYSGRRTIIEKYRRWRASAWKHNLCYKESMWSAFWSGVWSHIIKPASLLGK